VNDPLTGNAGFTDELLIVTVYVAGAVQLLQEAALFWADEQAPSERAVQAASATKME
jgi:hypothetical protein